jgi:hypothetical protein
MVLLESLICPNSIGRLFSLRLPGNITLLNCPVVYQAHNFNVFQVVKLWGNCPHAHMLRDEYHILHRRQERVKEDVLAGLLQAIRGRCDAFSLQTL